MRRFLLYAFLAVAALVVVITAVGYALPQGHVVTRDALVNAPPARVFDDIIRVAAHPHWRPGVDRVEVLSEQPLRWKEHAGGDVITFEATTARPPEVFVSRIADPGLPFGGTWTFELRPEGAGTRVSITEHGEVYNPVFRFLSRFVFGHTSGMEAYLDALRRRHGTMQ